MFLFEILKAACRTDKIVTPDDLVNVVFDLLDVLLGVDVLHVRPVHVILWTQNLSVFTENTTDLLDPRLNTVNDTEFLFEFRFREEVERVDVFVATPEAVNTTDSLNEAQWIPVKVVVDD